MNSGVYGVSDPSITSTCLSVFYADGDPVTGQAGHHRHAGSEDGEKEEEDLV